MFCVNCGAGSQTGKFCTACGQVLDTPPPPPPTANPPSLPTVPAATAPFPPAQPVTPAPVPLPPQVHAGVGTVPSPASTMPGVTVYPQPAPVDRTSQKVGITAAVAGAVVLLVGGLLFFNTVGDPTPEIDMTRPDSRLMNLNDFSYDMTFWDDRTAIEDRAYPVFGRGDDCPADTSMARILDRGQVVASRYFLSGDTLIQYVNFEQVIVEFTSASTLDNVIDIVREGYTSGVCEFEGESLRTRFFGLSDGPDSFEVIGENSIVFNRDTIYDSSVLDATVRGISVWIVQDNYLIVTEASLDIDVSSGINYQQLFRSVEDAIAKAYARTG